MFKKEKKKRKEKRMTVLLFVLSGIKMDLTSPVKTAAPLQIGQYIYHTLCAFLESIFSLEPSSVITEPRCLKLVTVSSFCPFSLISVLMPLLLFVLTNIRINRHRTAG